MPRSLRAIGLVHNLTEPPIDHKVNSMILKSDRATIAMAIGLTIGAIRATFLTRSWIILAIGLLADKLACSSIGLHRHAVAQRWSAEITRQIPEKLQEFFDKAWIGPLGLAAPFFNLSEATTANDIIKSLLGILFTLTMQASATIINDKQKMPIRWKGMTRQHRRHDCANTTTAIYHQAAMFKSSDADA